MRQLDDDKTMDLLGTLPRRRGKPLGDRPAMSAAQRQAARRKRLAEEGKGILTVEVTLEVIDALDSFVKFKDENKGSVVDRVLRDRLIRKR